MVRMRIIQGTIHTRVNTMGALVRDGLDGWESARRALNMLGVSPADFQAATEALWIDEYVYLVFMGGKLSGIIPS